MKQAIKKIEKELKECEARRSTNNNKQLHKEDIKMKKKICYGCKAFFQSGIKVSCDLGYDIEFDDPTDLLSGYVNRQSCPKPRTIKELYKIKSYHQNR